MKDKIVKKYDKDKDKLKIEEKIPLKKLSEKSIKILESKPIYYFASKKSDILHASNCPYGKNIKKVNRIIFKDLKDASTYKRCKCMF